MVIGSSSVIERLNHYTLGYNFEWCILSNPLHCEFHHGSLEWVVCGLPEGQVPSHCCCQEGVHIYRSDTKIVCLHVCLFVLEHIFNVWNQKLAFKPRPS